MTYKTVRLGDYIEKIEQYGSHDLTITDVRGVSITKKFTPTKARMTDVDISGYNVVKIGQFAFNPNTARMGEKICVALNEQRPFLVSKIYPVFQISKPNELLADYLYQYFAREEFDRYVRFNSWGSARETFNFEDFCDVEIPLPPIDKQREYVAIYSNLLKLSTNHEKSFADLQFITNTLTEKLVEKYGTEELGKYIAQTDTRNRDLAVKKVQGVSIQKKFIDSKANMDGVPLSGYKVVRPGEFAYVTVTSRNGQKISVALNTSGEPCIVSSTYITFTVANTDKLMAEFLLLWFKRPEFDRYARYNSWGSARETFDWSEMARVRIPVPPLAVQKSIVAIYHALESRKALNERLKNTIKDISPVLIKDAKDRCMEATG
jgi:type I restriction enzyme S subunit